MRLSNIDLLNEFFEKERENYPKVSYDQFRDIIAGPWKHFASIMEQGTLEEVRIKYFGNFLVYPKKAQAELKNLERRFKEGIVTEKDYNRIKPMINKFLNEQS